MYRIAILSVLLSIYSLNVYSQADTTITKVPLGKIKEIFLKINRYRSSKGLNPLVFSRELEQHCSKWAKECVEEDKFVHQLFGLNALKTSECMWKGSSYQTDMGRHVDPAKSWYESKQGHNKIIMDYRAKYVGIAGYSNGNYDIFVLRILNVE